ncbi:MAG TPA: hypothetical protein PLB35_01520 [Myxococcota bacterium]|mgnify:CR=1 FL=1|nr:hypothetical protein [Myxococcota bacterium]HOA12967.1 hypothetical protein [Myxococcota bacterium]HOH75912.1 hypothetical protein [Myxococcota bacterium]HPV03191.1 hypothetical protein [Myxococcota bacterium]
MNDRKVLIYEDDQTTLNQIQSVLTSLGLVPVIDTNPAAILEHAAEHKPDLIILSADMKHGFSACLKIKKDKTLRRIPLFMISGKTAADVINKHQRLPTRADVYLSTPLSTVMLTEILREQIPALPVQQAQPVTTGFEPPAEIDVNDIPDRTMVSARTIEAAVVNFVEDEVRDLKSTVVKLQTEKQDLNGKLGDLESLLRNQSETLNSSILAMREHQEVLKRTAQSDTSALQDMNRLIDEAVQEAVSKANLQAEAVAEKARLKLENELQDALSRIEALKEAADETASQRKQIAKLEKQLEDTRRREAERRADAESREAAVRADMDETLELFGRLETGYKENIEALEEERDSLQERLSETEDTVQDLREQVSRFESMAREFPALQEAAAKNEVLSAENRKLQRTLDRMQDRVEELQDIEKEAASLRAQLETAKSAERLVRAELDDIRKKFVQVKSLLGLNHQESGDPEDPGAKAAGEGRS